MASSRQTNSHPLSERWPQFKERYHPLHLGNWPTPIEPLVVRCGLGGQVIWIKREDKSSGVYGGNKLRKLEMLLADRPKHVITAGPLGSHHVLATSIHSASIGATTTALLVPQPMNDHHNLVHRLIQERCAVIVPTTPRSWPSELKKFATGALQSLPHPRGLKIVAPGGSSPLGTLGYVAAGLEIAEAVSQGDCPAPRRVYVPLGTGGTAVGLSLGLSIGGLNSEVVAVRVASLLAGNTPYLNALAARVSAILIRCGSVKAAPSLNVRIDHRFIGPGYGHATAAGISAQKNAQGWKMELETTYSAKTLAALLADLEANRDIGPVMFLNTYGPIDHLVGAASTNKVVS